MADFSRGWWPKISSPEPETPWQRRSQPRPRKASFAVESRVSRLRRALLRRFNYWHGRSVAYRDAEPLAFIESHRLSCHLYWLS